MRVDICVVTFRRPRSLMRLLGALEELRLEPEGGPEAAAPELRVVVVDNDAECSARAVCESARSFLSHPLVYLVEKRRGIPQARNTAVAASLGHSDFLAFIDDDEWPEPDWLSELLRVQAMRGADAVAGPALPVFESGAPRWIERGGFFESPRHTTGARIEYAFTHNVLVRTAVVARMDRLFDERLALVGGEDDEFFRRIAAAGRRIVFADSARVHEQIPHSRARLGWILRRSFRVGSATTWIDRADGASPPRRLEIAAHGAWCVLRGGLLLAAAAVRGRAAGARALRLVSYGAGRLAGLAGVAYPEYRRIHGA